MSYLLNITSDDKKSNEKTDNFSINFSPPVPLSGNWEIALESCSMWYSYYNISTDYNNNTFRYYNSSVWKNITITNGLYTIEDLNTFLQAAMKANGDYTAGSPDVYYIEITPNYNTFKLRITVSNSYQVDLTVGTLYQLFGFDPIVVSTTQEGANNVNITNGVNRIMLHVDCVTGSYKGQSSSDIIYSFTADGSPSSLLTIKPNRLLFLPINKSGNLDVIRVYITDQLNRRVNLNGEELSVVLFLRKKR